MGMKEISTPKQQPAIEQTKTPANLRAETQTRQRLADELKRLQLPTDEATPEHRNIDHALFTRPEYQNDKIKIEVGKSELGIEDVRKFIKEINPGYKFRFVFPQYEKNCGSCAYAVFKRLSGEDSLAIGSMKNIPTASEMNMLTRLEQVEMSPGEIERQLLLLGKGSHCIVGIDRDCGCPGHWFNAFCDGEKVYAIDGQNATITDWPPDYDWPGAPVVKWDISGRREQP